jgi:hypothetical protein
LSPLVELDCLVGERALAEGDAPQALEALRPLDAGFPY